MSQPKDRVLLSRGAAYAIFMLRAGVVVALLTTAGASVALHLGVLST